MGIIEDAIQAAELIEDRTGKAETERGKLQEAVRELREALAEARDVSRDLRALEARIGQLIEQGVTERIESEVKIQIDKLSGLTEEQMRKTSNKIISEFDRLRDVLLGQEANDDGKSIPQMMEEMRLALDLKWPHFVKAIHAAAVTLRGCSADDCKNDSEYGVVWMLDLPDGRRGESHAHLCAEHREELKKDETVTVIKSYRIDNQMCPLPHDNMKLFNWSSEAGISAREEI